MTTNLEYISLFGNVFVGLMTQLTNSVKALKKGEQSSRKISISPGQPCHVTIIQHACSYNTNKYDINITIKSKHTE